MPRLTWIAFLCIFMTAAAMGADQPRWLRYPAISPDGRQIAFSYRGDLWLGPVEGGAARLLTSHEGYERSPVWSPDGKSIAFASDRHGNFDVFLMPSTGGAATRLTFHSVSDEPACFSPDGQRLYFASSRLDAPDASVGNSRMPELYSVPITGGRPRQELTTPAISASISRDGKQILYQDLKGYENEWRKHHTSSVARDIWLYEFANGKHTKLTDFDGEDRDPVWAPPPAPPAAGGKPAAVYYLSERSGNFNVWQLDLANPKQTMQVTKHAPHPVRFLTIANNGTLCYGYNGDIWVKFAGKEPQRVAIEVTSDERDNGEQLLTLRDGATEMAVSPKEDEVAFVVRGDIFVTSVDHNTTKRITSTPGQERSVSFSPDGRTLFYAAEREESWGLYRTTLARDDEDRFHLSTVLLEKPVLVTFKGESEDFQPVLSPDGKQIAYIHNRDEIRVLDLASGKSKTIVPAERNYSYRDGDIQFAWSPDSKWLSFGYLPYRRWIDDIGVAEVATGKIVNISESGYVEGDPQWSRDSRALLFYSNRYGRRNHGSWGSDGDLFALYLTQESYDRATLSPEDFDRLKKKEDEKKKKTDGGKEAAKEGDDKDDKDDKDAKPQPAKPVKIEFENREHRLRRVTSHSAPLGSYAMSPDGESVLYLAQVERKWDLWLSRPRDGETRKLLTLGDDEAGEIVFGKSGKNLFLRRGSGRIEKIDVSAAIAKPARGSTASTTIRSDAVSFTAELTVNLAAERDYLFEHMWRQVLRKFYDPKLHGVDWPALKKNYAAFLPSINNNWDFAELCSELLGELNASHTGCRHRPQVKDGDATASLGLLYDVKHEGTGLRVAEVIARGPVHKADSKIKPGVIITHIDGVELAPTLDPAALLNRKEGKLVRLALHNPAGNARWEEVIKPISDGEERNLLYERWVQQCRDLVTKLSNGRIGYVHVRGMNDSSFRRTFQEVLGLHSDAEALIVDTRHNGGGWLHDDLAAFLSGRDYLFFTPRGKNKGDLGAESHTRWTRPVVVVQCESNYSDAHMFPYTFKALGIGQLIGTPVAGTATAVWWETQIDPSLVFGIPQVGMVNSDGKYLENLPLNPDVLIYNDPQSVAKGRDLQLEKAVEVLLKK